MCVNNNVPDTGISSEEEVDTSGLGEFHVESIENLVPAGVLALQDHIRLIATVQVCHVYNIQKDVQMYWALGSSTISTFLIDYNLL